jgi:hypothetical protein
VTDYIDHGGDDAMLPEDIDDLRQRSDDYPAVRVKHEGPQLHHVLPARNAYSRNVTVQSTADPTQLEQIAAGDPRIRYIIILASTNPVYIGHDKQSVADGICGILPVGTSLTLPTSAPIWVRSTTATAIVSWWAGNWAD